MSGSPPVRVIWATPKSASLSIASSPFSLSTNCLGLCFQMSQKLHLAMHTLVTANSARRMEPLTNVLRMCRCFGFIESSLVGAPELEHRVSVGANLIVDWPFYLA